MSKKEKLCTFSQDMEGMLSDTDKDNGLSKEVRGMRVQDIQLNNLHTFKGHPFKVEENSEFYELVQSIKKEGVLIPILVRTNPYGEGYEIIAGHRRRLACEWIGVDKIPVVIRELDDNQAIIAMVDSNLQREHIKPSEKAFAFKMKLEAMKRQGARTDLTVIEEYAENLTLSQVGTKLESKLETGDNGSNMGLRTDEILAKQVGESRNQIARYIRLTSLIPKILNMVDDEKMALSTAVEISFLTEEEQYELYTVMDLEQCTPSLSQAQRLKRMSREGNLDMDNIYHVLGEEKPNQREQIKIRAEVLEEYFPKEFTPNQKVELIENLVKEWYEKQVKGKGHKKEKSR